MKLALLIAALGLFAATPQSTPGTVTVATTSTVTATAGTITCAVTASTPAPATGIHIACKAGNGDSVTQDAVISASGITGAFNVGADSATWIVSQSSTGGMQWQVAANGVMKSGGF